MQRRDLVDITPAAPRPDISASLVSSRPPIADTAEVDPTATMRAHPRRHPPGETPAAERELAFWVPEAAALPALTLGPDDAELKVTGLLGEGGTGQVLLAEQRSMGREVAVKVPRVSEPWLAATLLAEGRLAGRVEHPNVVPIYALGRREDGAPILVMKRVRGESWETLLRDSAHPLWERFGRVTDRLERHLHIFLAAADGIAAAHRAGILHRDIKPANVLVAGPDEVLVIDWGLATEVDARPERKPLVGTPAFMAPEMLDPRMASDARLDIYELGATLHYVLTGAHRNVGATTAAILEGLSRPSEPDLRDHPEGLAQIVRKATAYATADRYATAADLAADLRRWLDERAADHLIVRADERMDELALLIEADAPLAELMAPAAACRASVEDALQLAPAHEGANDAAHRYFALWAGHLLDRGALDLARAELTPSRPTPLTAPASLIADFGRLSTGARERHERLDTLERDLDLRPEAETRRRFFLLGALYAGVSSLLALTVLPELIAERAPGLSPILAAGLANIAFWIVAALYRHRLLHNSASRRIMAWLAITVALLFLHRLVSLGLYDDTLAEVAARDCLLLAALSTFATIVLAPTFWPAPVAALLAFALALASPPLARHGFGAAMVLNLLIAASVWGSPREPRVPTRRRRLPGLRGPPS
jgi:serine/threonine-protein kinase